ncbi:hypothetical protein D3C74_478090 [compost metagenome]
MRFGPPYYLHRVKIQDRTVKRIAQHIRLTPLLLHTELFHQPNAELGMQGLPVTCLD